MEFEVYEDCRTCARGQVYTPTDGQESPGQEQRPDGNLPVRVDLFEVRREYEAIVPRKAPGEPRSSLLDGIENEKCHGDSETGDDRGKVGRAKTLSEYLQRYVAAEQSGQMLVILSVKEPMVGLPGRGQDCLDI